MAFEIPETDLPMTADETKQWMTRIREADTRRQQFEKWWDAALKSYSPDVTENPEGYQTRIRTNRTFTIVERKSAELFYQRPELTVEPSPLLSEIPNGVDVAATHAAILNEKLGLDEVNVKDIARRVIFDYLMFGAGWTLMGYRAYTQDVPVPVTVPGLDGVTPMPVMGEDGQPAMTSQPVVVKSTCFLEHLSPKQVIIPKGWTSTEFDKSPFLGWKFEMGLTAARRVLNLPEDFKGSINAERQNTKFDHGDSSHVTASQDIVTGQMLWYRSSEFRADVVHPDLLTEVIFVDGLTDGPVVHRDCPLQKVDERGRLTPDSLVGYPMDALVIRTQTDAAYLMSDVAVALPLVNELDTYRTQMVEQREINKQRGFYNTDIVTREMLDKIERANNGSLIGIPGVAFTQQFVKWMEKADYPRENFETNNYLDNDLARTHAIDATSAGTTAESGLTATEANLRQANVNVRLGWEQSFVADWFVRVATKYSTIIQQYLPVEDAAQIVGQAKAQLWDSMRHAVPARFAFTMTPDSSLRNDTPLDRKQLQDLYTFLANDPSLNRRHLAEKLALKYHLDPSKLLLPQEQVPQPKPAPPSLSLTFKGDDFSPLNPQAPVMMDLWQKLSGIPINKVAVENATTLGIMAMHAQAMKGQEGQSEDGQPPHGGKVPQVEGLSKHAADLTGAQNGSGQMVPQLGGGNAGL